MNFGRLVVDSIRKVVLRGRNGIDEEEGVNRDVCAAFISEMRLRTVGVRKAKREGSE